MTTHTTSNGKVLTAHEATISTAQVEIQTLRVGKKQVTMGMFRQIPYEPLIDLDTMTLRGVPWGHVRYWWEGCGEYAGDRSGTLHVLWQQAGSLYRALVSSWCSTPEQDQMDRRARWYETAAFLGLHHGAMQAGQTRGGSLMTRRYPVDGLEVAAYLSDDDRMTVDAYWMDKEYYERKMISHERWATTGQHYAALLAKFTVQERTPAQCLALREQALARKEAIAQQYAALVQDLSQLPQLFIAV